MAAEAARQQQRLQSAASFEASALLPQAASAKASAAVVEQQCTALRTAACTRRFDGGKQKGAAHALGPTCAEVCGETEPSARAESQSCPRTECGALACIERVVKRGPPWVVPTFVRKLLLYEAQVARARALIRDGYSRPGGKMQRAAALGNTWPLMNGMYVSDFASSDTTASVFPCCCMF